MAFVNYNNKEITVKIVYYGPALSGKTTCLQYTYSSKEYKKKGKLITLDTDGDRTLFFDFLPIEIGKLGDYSIKMQLYTVPGQVAYDTTRKLVLQGSDGVVFVADSQVVMREQNIASFKNLKDNLKANNIPFAETPLIFQYNKRDLKDVLPVETLNKDLNEHNKPFFPTIATSGENVLEGLHTIMKMVIIHLKNKLTIFQKDKTVMFSREEITDTLATQKRLEETHQDIDTGDNLVADTEKEEVFELSGPMDEDSLRTNPYPQSIPDPSPPSSAPAEQEEEIFNLGDDNIIGDNSSDMDFEVPDVVMQDELGGQDEPAPHEPPPPVVEIAPDEPEPLMLQDDEPLDLSPDDEVAFPATNHGSENAIGANDPVSFLPEPVPEKEPEVIYAKPSSTNVPVEVAIDKLPGQQSDVDGTYNIPINVQLPADKDEVKININLQIVVRKK